MMLPAEDDIDRTQEEEEIRGFINGRVQFLKEKERGNQEGKQRRETKTKRIKW